MKFYGSTQGLKVVDGRDSDWLIVAKFMQSANQTKFGNYMERIATELAEMKPFSKEMADYLEGAKAKVSNARTAESFLEEVQF